MGHIYAVREDTGERVLVAIQCDVCNAEVKPNPDIAASGWVEEGWYNGPGTRKFRQMYCEHCAKNQR
jgi:hypothetical protein